MFLLPEFLFASSFETDFRVVYLFIYHGKGGKVGWVCHVTKVWNLIWKDERVIANWPQAYLEAFHLYRDEIYLSEDVLLTYFWSDR